MISSNHRPRKMKLKTQSFIISLLSIFLISCLPPILGQQPYIGQLIEDCDLRDNSTSVLGYNCNGPRRSCQAYLTFRAQPPYSTVAAISTLLAANQSQLAQLNSLSENAVLETDRVVLVPVTCSCSGQQYQVNASYTVQTENSYFVIANNTFQGLSTCQALQVQNNVSGRGLGVGQRLTVPLRCACPTQAQIDDGVNFLLSYLITWNQFVYAIATLFGVDTAKTLAANGLSETDSNVYPFTTLLVPLENPPTSSQVTVPQPPPPPSGTALPTVPTSGGGKSKTWVYVVVAVVGVVALVSVAGAVVFYRRRKKKPEPAVSSQSFGSVEKPLKKEGDYDDSREFLESISSIAQSLKVYPFQQLKAATEDFSPSCWIKGSVYRGTINGDLAAIKKMSGDVSKEINLLNKINHFNLIRLSGVSFNEGNWYLVYEYASNGALGEWIRGKSEQRILNWEKRLQIAVDVAAGLNYLHRYTSPPHIHKDLNSSNILLDHDFRAKIANFGLARSTEGQGGQFALTRHIVGTKGYMAPEYLENGVVSVKLDVYSFGVLLLEILTGKEVSMLYEDVTLQLSELLTPVLSEGGQENVSNLIDPLLLGDYPTDLALVLFRMVDVCLKKDPAARPSMDDIFQSLTRISTSMLSGELAISISESGANPR